MKIAFAATPQIQLVLGSTHPPAPCGDGVLRLGPSRYLIVGEKPPTDPAQCVMGLYVVDLSPMFSTMEVTGPGYRELVANFASSHLIGSPHRAPTLLISKFAETVAIIDMRGAQRTKIHVHRSYAPYVHQLLSRSDPEMSVVLLHRARR